MKDIRIREIDLGPRQMLLFDAEEQASANQKRVFDCLAGHVEKHGQAQLNRFVQWAGDALGWDAFTVLQHLFRLAHDLEINFRSNGAQITAGEAKQVLMDSPEANLQVVLNKPVDEAVFRRVKAFFKQIAEDPGSVDPLDQVELARRLAGRLRAWKRDLDGCRILAGRPGFPGKSDIDDGLDFILAISRKSDAFSLIQAFFADAVPLGRLAETVHAIRAFYADDARRWQMLLEFAEACKKTLSVKMDEPCVAEAYGRFQTILALPRPYDQVDEAWQLYRLLKSHHDRIAAQQTQQCRETALSKVGSLIRDMGKHLEAHGADDDLRNQALFTLRVKLRCINESKNIGRIERHVLAAEEAFEIFWDEAAGE
ncbi:MAG: hypothetical protein PVH87_23240 [Desulfobacteraceae bacterium]|jgi:hypothetical protein